MSLLLQLLGVFWLLLPAGVSNMAPVFVKKLNVLNYPIDGGAKFRNKELLGPNKTVRGLLFGTMAGIIVACLQVFLYEKTRAFALVDYSAINPLLLGFLLGFGALAGDALESFFKRQIGISPGQMWWFFDQTDWIVGAFLFLAPCATFEIKIYVMGLVMMGVLHPAINVIGYLLKIKKNIF